MMKRNPGKALSRVESKSGDPGGRSPGKKVRIVGLGKELTNVEYCIWRLFEWDDVAIDRKVSNRGSWVA